MSDNDNPTTLLERRNRRLLRLHPALRESFVALPADAQDATLDELHAAFGGDWTALKDILRLGMDAKKGQSHVSTTVAGVLGLVGKVDQGRDASADERFADGG